MKKNIQITLLLIIISSLTLYSSPQGSKGTEQPDVSTSPGIFVWVPEEIDGVRLENSKGEKTLTQALLSQNYQVLSFIDLQKTTSLKSLDRAIDKGKFKKIAKPLRLHADFAIIGIISSETYSTGTLNYARATAHIDVVDLQTGKILSSSHQAGIKAAGNTEIKANTSALRKCAFATISELMQDLETILI